MKVEVSWLGEPPERVVPLQGEIGVSIVKKNMHESELKLCQWAARRHGGSQADGPIEPIRQGKDVNQKRPTYVWLTP